MNIEKLRALWDGHAKTVHAYLLRLTKSEADAADYLQDLFCQLGRQPELLEKLHHEPRGFLLRLAHNAVVDQVRRAQVRERVFEKITVARAGEFAQAADPDQAMLRHELLAALEELPEEQRVVVHARLWKMRTLDDIARELGVSINTAASRYRYGVDKMRTRLRSLYEDFAPAASTRPTQSMKKTSKHSFSDPSTEQPIIRRLEQRRVPSATGAAFALPLPDNPDDAPVDEIPVDEVPVDEAPIEEVPTDAELIVESELIDPMPGEGEVVDGELTLTFEDIVTTLELGDPAEGEVGEPVLDGTVEEFNPDVIFYTLFTDEVVPDDEVIAIDDGEFVEGGEEGSIEFVEEVPVDDEGDGVSDGEVIEEPIAEDGGVIEDPDTIYTLEMVKRDLGETGGDDGVVTTTDTGVEWNPDWIFYSTAGGPVPGNVETSGALDSEAATDRPTEVPLQSQNDVPDVAGGAPEADVTADTVVTVGAFEVPEAGEMAAALPHDSAPLAQHFDVTVPAELSALPGDLAVGHELSTTDFASAPSVLAVPEAMALAGGQGMAPVEASVDQWVPVQGELAEAGPLIAHLDMLPTESSVEQELSVLGADAVVPAHHATLQGSTIAMAATGAVLLTRDAKVREDEERA